MALDLTCIVTGSVMLLQSSFPIWAVFLIWAEYASTGPSIHLDVVNMARPSQTPLSGIVTSLKLKLKNVDMWSLILSLSPMILQLVDKICAWLNREKWHPPFSRSLCALLAAWGVLLKALVISKVVALYTVVYLDMNDLYLIACHQKRHLWIRTGNPNPMYDLWSKLLRFFLHRSCVN